MPTVDFNMLNKIVNFNLHPIGILGNNRVNVRLLAILDADSAMAIADVKQMHINVYPTIPLIDRPADDFRSYQYLKIKQPNGSIEVIGIPWIEGQITTVVNNVIRVTINNVGGADVEKIRKALIANGYDEISLTLV